VPKKRTANRKIEDAQVLIVSVTADEKSVYSRCIGPSSHSRGVRASWLRTKKGETLFPNEGKTRATAKLLDVLIENFLDAEKKYQDLDEADKVSEMDEEWDQQPLESFEEQSLAKTNLPSGMSAALTSIHAVLKEVGIEYTEVKPKSAKRRYYQNREVCA
jgi:hypothetical protein